jgi:molybdopterin synthase catalytic subunit
MMRKTGIDEKGAIKLTDMLEILEKNPRKEEAGAVTIFIGRAKKYTRKNEMTEGLELDAYREKAEETLATISKELEKKSGITDVLIHHMIGNFKVGEDLVYVIVAGKSRKDAFPVLLEAVERYKHEAPIFKKELLKKGKPYWVSEDNKRKREFLGSQHKSDLASNP